MLLIDGKTGHFVEVADLTALCNPHKDAVAVRVDYGEEVSDPEIATKAELRFPSGEALPRCWVDPAYRDQRGRSRSAAHA